VGVGDGRRRQHCLEVGAARVQELSEVLGKVMGRTKSLRQSCSFGKYPAFRGSGSREEAPGGVRKGVSIPPGMLLDISRCDQAVALNFNY